MSTERWISLSYGYSTIVVGSIVLAMSKKLHIAVAFLLAHMLVYMIVAGLIQYRSWRPGPLLRVLIIVGDAAMTFFIVRNASPTLFLATLLPCGACVHMASAMMDISTRTKFAETK